MRVPVLGWTALLSALLGGAVAIPNAVHALRVVGGDPAYAGRLGFGWAALALAVAATLAGLLAPSRPIVAAATVIVAAIGGAASISLFYINTYYLAALPFWFLAAALALTGAPRRGRPGQHQ